jgi:L-threonylcarbamoyladenylate synthase
MILSAVAMKTDLLNADLPGAMEEAARLLGCGELVAFPTDTLYGVGASLFDGDAVRRLYEVKERPLTKGIPVLLADAQNVDQVAISLSDQARALMARFWPGPLTMIVTRRAGLPAILAPGDTIAIRLPDHALARRLFRAAGGAVATSSANLSGSRPALTAAEALAAFDGRIAAILDGGPVRLGQASTIVDCTVTPPRIIRQGPIPAEALLKVMAGSS